MNNPDKTLRMVWPLRAAIALTGIIDLAVGLLFLVGPELGLTPWPSPIPSLISRFIGAIVFANGVGTAMIVWDGTWTQARVLVMVSLVYGLLVLVAVPYDMIVYGKDTVLWGYVVVDIIFIVPIAIIYGVYEYMRWRRARTLNASA
jgi:hypothetical protein